MNPLRLTILGAEGRMGRTLIRTLAQHDSCRLVGAIVRPNSPWVGKDAGILAETGPLGVELHADVRSLGPITDSFIDFTTPASSLEFASIAGRTAAVYVLGTTGFTEQQKKDVLKSLAPNVCIYSENMSFGITLLQDFVRKAAHSLREEFDIEILEMHHRHKKDSPSGTALLLGRAAAAGRGRDFTDVLEKANTSLPRGPKEEGMIDFVALRGGSVMGEHHVIFAGPSERIVLTHQVDDRAIFARGAIHAAQWGQKKLPGVYSMADVLNLEAL